MTVNAKKLYLTDIAKEKSIKDHKDVLSALMPYDIIFANVDNAGILAEEDEFASPIALSLVGFWSIKIKEDYLQVILRKGCWSGRTMLATIRWLDDNPYMPEGRFRPIQVRANDSLSISLDDLFVYEHNLADLEKQNPDIFTRSTVSTLVQTSPCDTPSTGSRKDTIRIKATRQACEKVMEELNQEKQAFDNDKDNWTPNLLSDTGKTKKGTFMDAVKARLDAQPHRDTAAEFWKEVSADLKHSGRMPEQ